MNKKQLRQLYSIDLAIAQCKTCGMNKYGIVSITDRPTLFILDDQARCCSNPSLRWITGGEYSKNSLHRAHVRNTRRSNVNKN